MHSAREVRQASETKRVTVQLEGVQLDGFAAEAINEEADRLGVSINELVSFSVLYYLADIDSGRIARQILTGPYRHAASESSDPDSPDGVPPL